MTREELLSLPKSELHLHLRGAMPAVVFADLLNKYPIDRLWPHVFDRHKPLLQKHENIRPFLSPRHWNAEEVMELFRFGDFEQFIATWVFTRYFVRDADDLRLLVRGVVDELRRQRVVYAEITISVTEYVEQGVALGDLRACLEEASRQPGIRVQWIVDLVRDFGADAGMELLKEIIALKCDVIVGITIGGSEHRVPPGEFKEVYAVAREHGLRLTAHAGEVVGPESVWGALRELGVERIGHGVRATEDPVLVAHLAQNQIPLEVCPTSNLRTGVFPSYEAHSVRPLFEAGVPITINTDDPTFFGCSLVDEYLHLQEAGIGDDGIREMMRNGFKYAFLPRSESDEYLGKFDAEWTQQRR